MLWSDLSPSGNVDIATSILHLASTQVVIANFSKLHNITCKSKGNIMNSRVKVLFVVLLLFQGAGAETDWPSWGGPNRNFRVDDAGVFPVDQPYALRVVWKKPLGAGYSPISARGNLVVTMFSDETSDYVVGLNAEDGSELWKYEIGAAYLGHYGSQSGPLSTPVLTADEVIALGPRGSLFALNAKTGEKLWAVDLVADYGAKAPFWGFTSSPILHDNRLIVQTGGMHAISAFDPASGDLIWSAVDDSVAYQSPGLFAFGNRRHLVFYGDKYLAGLAPETGDVLWQFAHRGQAGAVNTSGYPVAVGKGRFFVKNGGMLVGVRADGDGFAVEEIWRTRHIRGTYIDAVFAKGLLFGYNRRILTCISADTGERLWRSREPGDGLPIVVDNHLVIMTKDGKLAVARTSGEGYRETARLALFDDIAWSHASFAHGKFYARSMSEIACVEVAPGIAASAGKRDEMAANSRFAQFVAEVDQSADKKTRIDQFMAKQKTFPILEGENLVHFVYRGAADDVTVTGDHVGRRFDQSMHRIEGTDLFFFTAQLKSDARITYRYTLNLQRSIPDPHNPRQIRSLFFGRASWFGMPRWQMPDHLKKRREGIHGRIDSARFESAAIQGHRKLEIYLPAGYAESDEHYPVVYVHAARRQWSLGKVDVSLDNIIGERVRPVIVVFVPSLFGGGYREYVGATRDAYTRVFTDEIVPYVDQTYRAIRHREARANMGTIYGGFMAFYATFTHPEIFGKMAIQSMSWDQTAEANDAALVFEASTQWPIKIYLDWGKYDLRSPMEGNDLGKSTASFARLLHKRGYTFAGGEVNDGAGWISWRNRTDEVFETLFPLVD